MGITFTSKGKAVQKSPTVADAIAAGVGFSTSYGTVYHRAQSGEFIKFGNPKRSDRNFVTVKPANYFNGRGDEAVTLLGNLEVAL